MSRPGVEQTAPIPRVRLPEVHEAWLPKEHDLYRPRHGGRQLLALLAALLFFGAPVFSFLLGSRATEIENRALVDFPNIMHGWGFFTEFPQWSIDYLPFRESAINAADTVSHVVFGESVSLNGGDDAGSGPITPGPGGDDDRRIAYPNVIEGSDGWLYLGSDVDSRCNRERSLDEVIDALQRLRTGIEASGREFVLVIAPDKTTAVPEHLPEDYAGKRCATEAATEFWNELPEATDAIDLREPLRERSAELGRPIYYPLDSHWMDEGAITMLTEVAEELKPGSTAAVTTDEHEIWESDADLPVLLGQKEQRAGMTYRIRPDGQTDNTHGLNYRLDEPEHFSVGPLAGMNTDRTAIIGDSFLAASSRYVSGFFSDVTLQYYGTLSDDPRSVIDMLIGQETIVIEVVERNLVGGTAPFLESEMIDRITADLGANPIS
ncbi:alginate O-acetyltransferase AlgX-related protein [Actinoalloteichus hymeniacidonis]|uniref:AlgX/AlgJ SGNH hydrolase-like domain-containing protein n=1 Tax=Actinoalloteichus hymeniacidonis TaxID=340345 RepID=A0AAC9HKJ1_9PSEU|nr:hypothetical protein [Actinoalloteichus hymeniacidonis]AOS60909.1 hypothetical protein TL08_00300 [Actinoalloteichus hymeniacidonis]MBB5911091.1 hypothetical protein [Actinoalloteichus hymeniacidonis]